jgi:hypothetical protein
MELTVMAVHQEPEVVPAARPTTLQVVTARLVEHVALHQTGAAAVAVAQQLQVRLQQLPAAMAEQVVHHPSREQASLSQAVAVAVAVTAATQATPLPQAAMAEQVVAEMVVPQFGTEPPAVQARVSVALSILAAVAVAVAIALAPKSLEATTAVAAPAVQELLLCAT